MSSFDWNWDLQANIPEKIPFLDDLGNLLFILTITSKINQNFTILTEFDKSTIQIPGSYEFLFKFVPDSPEDILYLTFFYPYGSSASVVLDSYEWQYWNSENGGWTTFSTNYNNLDHGWEATLTHNEEIFTLVNTGVTTTLVFTNQGQGLIGNTFGIFLFVFLSIPIIKKYFGRKNKHLR